VRPVRQPSSAALAGHPGASAPPGWAPSERKPRAIHQSMAFEEGRDVPGVRTRVVREPVGVVRAIIPWNGLVAAAAFKLGPALAAGCTVVLKPAPEGPLTSYLLAEAIEAAGLP